MKPTLHQLAMKYASDKLYWHSYIPMYERLFDGLEVHRLLEIGIGYKDLMQPFLPKGTDYIHGSSLKMFEEFFPEAQIFACDIRPDTLINEGRIHSVQCDQADLDSLMQMIVGTGCASFDLIIDDGSHRYEHQRFTASHLLSFVNVGGLYVVEDIWPEDGNKLAKEFDGEFWQGEKGRDDGLVIIRK